jgi:serine/threonine protein kinase
LDLLNEFIDLGFSDHWFLVTLKSLPQSISPTIRLDFVRAQDLVLTQSIDLEKGDNGRHQHFARGERTPFETKSVLGSGGFGQVDRVLSLISYKEYARKRVRRRTVFGNAAAEAMKRFIAKVEILKRLKHRRMVEFVGSYTDPTYLGLIMSPVAEMDLAAYLQNFSTGEPRAANVLWLFSYSAPISTRSSDST